MRGSVREDIRDGLREANGVRKGSGGRALRNTRPFRGQNHGPIK